MQYENAKNQLKTNKTGIIAFVRRYVPKSENVLWPGNVKQSREAQSLRFDCGNVMGDKAMIVAWLST